MSDLIALIIFLSSLPIVTICAVVAINSIVTPWEFYEYKHQVRELRQTGYTDKEICKKLNISKSFLKEVESEEKEVSNNG